jgi:hypothetical protein
MRPSSGFGVPCLKSLTLQSISDRALYSDLVSHSNVLMMIFGCRLFIMFQQGDQKAYNSSPWSIVLEWRRTTKNFRERIDVRKF